MMPWMPLKFFWIMPLMCIAMFLIRTFWFRRRLPGFARMAHLPEREEQTTSGKMSSGPIPEELKQAGQQVLESLDWEIRLLEGQITAIDDPKKRQEIEKELRRKRDEYQTTVNRLEL